jgi:hypothetical protein
MVKFLFRDDCDSGGKFGFCEALCGDEGGGGDYDRALSINFLGALGK